MENFVNIYLCVDLLGCQKNVLLLVGGLTACLLLGITSYVKLIKTHHFLKIN